MRSKAECVHAERDKAPGYPGATRVSREPDTHCNSEPIVRHTSSVSRQILESDEPIEMVDGDLGDGIRLVQAQVDRDPASSVLAWCLRPPVRDAPAGGAEVEL